MSAEDRTTVDTPFQFPSSQISWVATAHPYPQQQPPNAVFSFDSLTAALPQRVVPQRNTMARRGFVIDVPPFDFSFQAASVTQPGAPSPPSMWAGTLTKNWTTNMTKMGINEATALRPQR